VSDLRSIRGICLEGIKWSTKDLSMTSDLLAQIWTQDLPHTEQDGQPLDRDILLLDSAHLTKCSMYLATEMQTGWLTRQELPYINHKKRGHLRKEGSKEEDIQMVTFLLIKIPSQRSNFMVTKLKGFIV
jgi:hypothetical protein